jgi:predicted Zn-dependent peptidase
MSKVLLRSYKNLRTCILGIVTNYGAAHDKLAGTNQVLLQTMGRGTDNFTERQIARMIEGTGGVLFTSTEKDFSVIGAQVLPKHVERTLNLLFDIITNPSLNEHHFLIEKQHLIEVYQQVKVNSLRKMLLFDADRAVFGNHPLGRSQIGSEETLNQIQLEDIQQTHKNIIVEPWGFAIGAISNELNQIIERKMYKFLSEKKYKKLTEYSFPKQVIKPMNLITSSNPEDRNAYLCVNLKTQITPEIMGLARFSGALLGESFGSRMFKILRDQKAFGYMIGANIKLLDKSLILRCFMETSPKRAEEALDSLLELITDLGKNQISENEHQTTREYILGALDLSYDNTRGLASRIINRKVHGLSSRLDRSYEEIREVKPGPLLEWWKTILQPQNLSLAVSGKIVPASLESKWTAQDVG